MNKDLEMKKSELLEIVQQVINEKKGRLKEEDFNGVLSPQEKIARRKVEQGKIELARANQMQSQKNLAQIK